MYLFASSAMHISVKSEKLFELAGFPVTNSHVLGFFGLVFLVWAMLRTKAAVLGKKKHNFLTRLIFFVFKTLYEIVKQVIPEEKWARRVAPLTITIFFFVIAQYYLGILPIVGPIYLQDGHAHTPIFRGGVADLNMTFGLAIVTIIAAQLYAIKYLGVFGNAGRYLVNPLKDPIGSFVGILEILAEGSRLLGLSFRLFGNVLAGEVLLVVVGVLTQFISPVALQPFYIFELFIGGIQAYVFFMLSTVFISLGLAHHSEGAEDSHPDNDHHKVAARG